MKSDEDQLQFDFLHRNENNAESQNHLNKNRKPFSSNCKKVRDRLLNGEELRVLQCANEGIASLPRRIKDLREGGIELSDRWEGNIKVYYMTVEQIKHYQDKIKEITSRYLKKLE